MILKCLSIISTVVIIKQKKFQLIEKTQSCHEIVDIEIQFRRNETVDNNLEKRKIDIFQKFKKE